MNPPRMRLKLLSMSTEFPKSTLQFIIYNRSSNTITFRYLSCTVRYIIFPSPDVHPLSLSFT